jgi:hypothetical protein
MFSETRACSAVVGRIDHDQDASGLSNGRAVRVFELAVGHDHGKSVGKRGAISASTKRWNSVSAIVEPCVLDSPERVPSD